MTKERNSDICRLYKSGLTLKEAGERYGLSRERARQIVRNAIKERAQELHGQGVSIEDARKQAAEEFTWNHEQNMTPNRDEFLGVNLSEEDKTALRQEAERRGISMSMLTSDLIKTMLASRELRREETTSS